MYGVAVRTFWKGSLPGGLLLVGAQVPLRPLPQMPGGVFFGCCFCSHCCCTPEVFSLDTPVVYIAATGIAAPNIPAARAAVAPWWSPGGLLSGCHCSYSHSCHHCSCWSLTAANNTDDWAAAAHLTIVIDPLPLTTSTTAQRFAARETPGSVAHDYIHFETPVRAWGMRYWWFSCYCHLGESSCTCLGTPTRTWRLRVRCLWVWLYLEFSS